MAKKKRKTRKEKATTTHHLEHLKKRGIQARQTKKPSIESVSSVDFVENKIARQEVFKTVSFAGVFLMILIVIYFLAVRTEVFEPILELFGAGGLY